MSEGEAVADLAAAIATIEHCKDIHNQWIEHLTICPGCPSESTAGNIAHHQAINAEYDNVLSVLRDPRLQEWVDHNRRHILNHLDDAQGQRNLILASCAQAQLDIVNRLERQMLLEEPVGAQWKIP